LNLRRVNRDVRSALLVRDAEPDPVHLGIDQFDSPTRRISAGTSSARITVASSTIVWTPGRQRTAGGDSRFRFTREGVAGSIPAAPSRVTSMNGSDKSEPLMSRAHRVGV
jgi:hypothetical protein